ncbi:cytochrome P450 monooxygenase 38 [Stylosanthes scabra]|uniref:peptidylprolyl isomerase n=1 Tax=Stylosanthes scabra TaxID=79078 RepID=A0ABU6QHZ1_9FABA|nr:cytochrome P450 monooxygenase 38 [Stylosanthes scabra]
MAATIPSHYYASAPITSKFFISNNAHSKRLTYPLSLTNAPRFRGFNAARCSYQPPPHHSQLQSKHKGSSFNLKECAISIALAVGLITGVPALGLPANAHAASPVLPDLAVLISGPPIKDPGALLRYALPIDNKAIREVQKPLEDITDSLKIAGVKALDSVERNARQASRALKQGKTLIVSGLAESKKEHGIELLNKLEAGMDELELIVQDRNRDAVALKQKELLNYVGG